MKQIAIDGFRIQDLDDGTLQYFVQPPIKGLEFPALRVGSHDRAGDDGVEVTSVFLGERRIQLTGKVFNVTSASAHVALRREFLSVVAPQRDVNDLIIHKTLTFTTLDDAQYQLSIEVVGATMDWDNVRHSTFLIDILATQATIDSLEQFSKSISVVTRGGFILPVILPALLGAGSGGSSVLTNDGDTIAYPVITIIGPLTNPRITNNTTGEFISLVLGLTDGQSIVIDMLARTAVQGGITNQISAVSDDSSWFGLQPGDNELQISTGISGETGTATVTWHDTFVGI